MTERHTPPGGPIPHGPRRHPVRESLQRAAVVLALLGVATAAGLWLGDRMLIGPSHHVSIVNDTGAALDWSCSWSDLRLAPGETGAIRIPEEPHEQFGCVPRPASLRQDICPGLDSMTAGAEFTATAFVERFHCRS